MIKKSITGTMLALGLSTAFTGAAEACKSEQTALRTEATVAIDAATGTVLSGNNENVPFYQASLTKRMVLLLALDVIAADPSFKDKIISLSDTPYSNWYGVSEGKDAIPFKYKYVSVWDAIVAMNTMSSNRAPQALAIAIAGSEENFLSLMNAKAQEIRLSDSTYFAQILGYPTTPYVQANHRVTPLDHAKIVQHSMRHHRADMDALFVHKAELTGYKADMKPHRFSVKSTNPFLKEGKYFIPGIINGKTGTSCAVAAIDVEKEIEGRLVIFVIAAPSGSKRKENGYNLITNISNDFKEKLEYARTVEQQQAIQTMLTGSANFQFVPQFTGIQLSFVWKAALKPQAIQPVQWGKINILQALGIKPAYQTPFMQRASYPWWNENPLRRAIS